MASHIGRRKFLATLGGTAVAWPFAARAQQPAMPVVGFLSSGSPEPFTSLVANFGRGLSEVGFVKGQNVAVEFRWAKGQYDRLPALAADLVRRPIAVIVASGGMASVRAAKEATTTIPIVFTTGGDPVAAGLVAAFNRPGGNVTGVYVLATALEAKRLEMLHELAPKAAVIAMLVNPNSPLAPTQTKDVQAAARVIGQEVVILHASIEPDLDAAFATMVQQRAGALAVTADPFFFLQRDRIVALAARHAVPTIYSSREYATAGGLMSYATSVVDAYRLAGTYAGRILKGEKPADLPVQQSTKIELVINLKTAKSLGITFPLTLLARADEVIE